MQAPDTAGLLPQDIDAEQALLGSLLMDRHAISRVAFLRPDHFFLSTHAELFTVMQQLAAEDSPTDTVMVANRLKARNTLEMAGGVAYLASLAAVTPTSLHVAYYARIVERLSVLRRLVDAGVRITGIGYDEQLQADDALEEAERVLAAVSAGRTVPDLPDKTAVLQTLYDRLTGPAEDAGGLMTGLTYTLDRYTSGFQRGDLVIIGARTSAGKTALCTTIAWNVAIKHKKRVLFLSLEQLEEQIWQRLWTIGTNLSFAKLESHTLLPGELAALQMAVEKTKHSPINVITPHNRSVQSIVALARAVHEEHPLDLLIVDYLQKVEWTGKTDRRELEVARVSDRLKKLALDLKVPLITPAQLRRMEHSNVVPTIDDIAESAAAARDADVVILLHPQGEFTSQAISEVQAIIAKQRNRETGVVTLAFHQPFMRFADLERREQEHESRTATVAEFRPRIVPTEENNDQPF